MTWPGFCLPLSLKALLLPCLYLRGKVVTIGNRHDKIDEDGVLSTEPET